MTAKSIESVIYNALTNINPNVIQLPYTGERPSDSYITFQLMTIDLGNNGAWKRKNNGDGTFTEFTKYAATLYVDINAYGNKSYNDLIKLHGARRDFRVRGALAEGGVALLSVGKPKNLSDIGLQKHVRWQTEAQFSLRVETEFDDYILKQFVITGKFHNPIKEEDYEITTIAPPDA
ncbi:hypothetical protein X1_83 [Yersinia phage vB_Yen_X1]|nr:hypothetical protein X1_83 [Yersinia phage vB_Yen_X1]